MFLLAISPVGRAIAARIQGGGRIPDDQVERLEAGQQAVLDEMEALRHDVVEMQERLDFAERMLAQQRERRPAGRGRDAGRLVVAQTAAGVDLEARAGEGCRRPVGRPGRPAQSARRGTARAHAGGVR
jgi:hypothetical protein